MIRTAAALLLAAILASASLGTASAWAMARPEEMLPDPAQEERAREIGRDLRCMVCQNQSIEDSDADLARQLRVVVREQVAAGRSDEAVRDYLHARYGDFVLLRPPFNAVTALLWFTPLLAVLGGVTAIVLARRNARTEPASLTEAERERLSRLDDVGST